MKHGNRTMYNKGCRCLECKQANSDYRKAYRGKEKRLPAEHGERRMFVKGCRCKECSNANSEYSKALRSSMKQLTDICGTDSQYNKGCKCQECKNAHNTAVAARTYGITQEAVMALRDIKSCDICGTEINTTTSKTGNIDHCHITGRVRGMLCYNCNNGLGKFRDSIEILSVAIKYLQR